MTIRLAVITESVEIWGAEESLLLLSEYAAANHIKIILIVSEGSPLVRLARARRLACVEHRFASLPRSKPITRMQTIFSLLRFVWQPILGGLRLWRKLRHYDAVLVFSIWQAPESFIGGRLAGKRVLADIHETFQNERATRVLRTFLSAFDGVLVPSKYVAARTGLLGDDRKIRVVPRPVRVHHMEGNRPGNPYLVVGVFGQIVPHKRVAELVRMAKEAKHEWRLVIVGGKPTLGRAEYEQDIRRDVADLGDLVQVVDRVADPYPLMSLCDVIVNISEHEAFGRTVAEAASLGVWPIVLDKSGPGEIVDILKFGTVVQNLDEIEAELNDMARRFRGDTCNVGRLTPPERISLLSPSHIGSEYFGALRSLLAGSKGLSSLDLTSNALMVDERS